MGEDRLIGIIDILKGGRRVKAKEIADLYEVSIRTIYRDIEKLVSKGVDIKVTQGVGGGVVLLDDSNSAYDKIKKADKLDEGVSKDNISSNIELHNWIEHIISKGQDNSIHIIAIIDRSMSFRVYDELEGYWKLDDNEDFILNMDVVKNEWLYSYICSYGDKMKIIEPISLREEVKLRYAMAYRRYQ